MINKLTFNNPSLWVKNSRFTEGSPNGSTYEYVMHVSDNSGNRIVLVEPIKSPFKKMNIYINDGYEVAITGFDNDKLYLGKNQGYILAWTSNTLSSIKTNAQYLGIALRNKTTSVELSPQDIANVGFYIEYETLELKIFDRIYTNVKGIKATDEDGETILFTKFGDAIVSSKVITENGTYTASDENLDGYNVVTVSVSSGEAPTLQSKTATPSETAQTITADSGYDGLSSVAVEAISSTYVGSGVARKTSTDLTGQETEDGFTITAPTGYYEADATKTIQYGEITINELYWSRGEISVRLDTSSGYLPDSQGVGIGLVNMTYITNLPMQDSTDITPTETVQTIWGNQYLTGNITVEAIPSTYIGSGITQRTSTDLTASGATVTVPSGYYANQATKSVASGTEGTPTATKGTVSNHSISITPSVTNSEGYISGGTKTGTAVSVSASELVSGTYSVTSSGTKDVTNYASVSVPSGSAETPDTAITANPSISVSASGLITATASASKDITPSVSAGYVSSGTAGTVTVSGSNTQQLTTLGATTYNTSTTDQTITSGKYITGTQTIKAVTTSNLTAANVKAGTTIQVGDANDSDRIASVTGTFTSDATASAGDIKSGETAYVNGTKVTGTLVINKYYVGTSEPVASQYNDGDIYLKVVSN